MHMPGHKRNPLCMMPDPYSLDVTEVPGVDDLHHPLEMIRDLMDELTKYYDSKQTYLLVNGSTCGILAAITACCYPGDKILVARNCHKSVYNAIKLLGLRPVYVVPHRLEGMLGQLGIAGEIEVSEIRRRLKENPDIKCAMITSPTYEGIVSDIAGIAEAVHEKNIPLIVDEAHGAHFEFSDEFPESAVKAGADIVINSIHKTLPALTQTALLHISGNYVDYDKVERFWNIYQTTSPSYILMASIDRCMRIIEEQGDYIFKEYINRLKNLRENIAKLNNIRLMDSDDISKIILICDDGKYLYDRLLDEYKVQLEMASFKYVIAMTSVADKQEYYDRFLSALKEIDESWKVESKDSENAVGESLGYAINNKPEVCMCPADAIDLMDENGYEDLSVNSPDICGRISMSSVLIYPPGMPVVNVGERITDDVCRIIKSAINAGLEVPGLKEGKIRCLR